MADRPMVIFGDGTQTRDFTYVSDTAAGIIMAGEHADSVGQTFNLGSGSDVTINELADRVRAIVGKPNAPVHHDRQRPGDVLRLCADMSRARAVLNYQPRMSLDDGLRGLLAWYRSLTATPEQMLEDEVVHNWAR
jgi:UDP-glucose 4-epimerase